MSTTPETRIEYTYTTKKGVQVVVSGVPVTVAREPNGQEHQVFSMAVAMRLEELIKRIKTQMPPKAAFKDLSFRATKNENTPLRPSHPDC
jgi:hypothetical protein